jgi:uncharacterized protein (TIGR03000 family)
MRLLGMKAVLCAACLAFAAADASAQQYVGYGGYGMYSAPGYGSYGGYGVRRGYASGGWYSGRSGIGYGYGGYGYYPMVGSNYYGYTPYIYRSEYRYAPSYAVPGAFDSGRSSNEYRSLYPPGTDLSMAPAGNTGLLRVHTAPSAQLWFDGTAMTQTGAVRSFSTPELQPGKTYTYEVKIRWLEDGKPVERTRNIDITAKSAVDVDLTPSNLK